MNVAYNRGKRSMTLDLRHERAGDVLRRLVRNVDVVIESARPGSMEARGIGYADLSEENPGLVWCSITGFGRGSPYADRPAHDVTFLGYAGLLSLMVGDTVPAAPQFVIAVPIGALMATVGILVASRTLTAPGRARRSTRASSTRQRGCSASTYTRRAGQRRGWGDNASRRTYRCAEAVSSLAAAEPVRGAPSVRLERPDLLGRLGDADQDTLTPDLAAIFVERPSTEWVEWLAPTAACLGPVNLPRICSTIHTSSRARVSSGSTAARAKPSTRIRCGSSRGRDPRLTAGRAREPARNRRGTRGSGFHPRRDPLPPSRGCRMTVAIDLTGHHGS